MSNNLGLSKFQVSEPLSLFQNPIKPFLKWAGGKSQLLPKLEKYIPASFNKYIEPFIGGGALYFYINPSTPIISDLNEELIITYKTVKSNVEDIINILATYENNEDFYYKIRSINPSSINDIERAARLIYLNKTCFNGLYRVNKKGVFNVPYGKRNGEFLNKELLRDASNFLQNAIIINSDFLKTLSHYASEGDLVFLDPPYYPVGKYSDFKRYTKEFFYHEDHLKLRNEFDRLVNLGCYVILTNSNNSQILDLYSKYEVKVFNTKRLISSNPNTRDGQDIIVLGNL